MATFASTSASDMPGPSSGSRSAPPSRRPSIGNIFRNRSRDRDKTRDSSQHEDQQDRQGEAAGYDDLEAQDNYDEYVDKASNDPLGRMFLRLMKTNQELSKKCKVETNIDIGQMCRDFVLSTEMKERDLDYKLAATENSLERKLLEKELNSSILDHGVNPPSSFSLFPVLTGWEQRKEVQKLFPVNNKFSGAVAKEGQSGVTVSEFLTAMNRGQQHCNLSEAEFTDILLLCTTGRAHQLISEWMEQEESIKDIYHSLIMVYDRRTSPEDAKASLASFKIRKNSNLSKAAGAIQNLAMRSSCTLPAGKSRSDFYNMEAVHTLINALPPASSTQAMNVYQKLSSQLSRACTFTELVKALSIYRATIDSDIKQHGVESDQNQKGKGNQKGQNYGKGKNKSQDKQAAAYAMQASTLSVQSGNNVSQGGG